MMREANEWFPGISSNYKTYPHYRNEFAISFESATLEDINEQLPSWDENSEDHLLELAETSNEGGSPISIGLWRLKPTVAL